MIFLYQHHPELTAKAEAMLCSSAPGQVKKFLFHPYARCQLAGSTISTGGLQETSPAGLELTETGPYMLRLMQGSRAHGSCLYLHMYLCLYPTAWEVKIATFFSRILPREAPVQRSFGLKNQKYFLAFILLNGEKFLKNSFASKCIRDSFYSTWIK